MTSNECYPQTVLLEQAIAEAHLGPQGKLVASILVENFLEYEHGTADIEDVFANIPGFDLSGEDDDNVRRRMCLTMYRKVLEDVILEIAYG